MNQNSQQQEVPPGQSATKIYILCATLFTGFFIIDLLTPLGVAVGVTYVSVVLVSLWASEKKITLVVAVISSILTLAGLFYSPQGGERWKVLSNRGLSLFAIWTTAALTLQRKTIEEKRLEAVQEREKILAATKILRGLLPICASCKKIRDDQGYWNQIEAYIEKHSAAHFTHGICKECEERLYGDDE